MMRKEKRNPFDEEFAVAADDFFAGTIERNGREDAELSALLDTLERVDSAFADEAEATAKEQIRRGVRQAWFELEAERAAPRQDWLSQVRAFFWRNQTQTRLAVSFAMILLVMVAMPFFLQNESNMAGAAGWGDLSAGITVILILGLLATLFVIFKRPK